MIMSNNTKRKVYMETDKYKVRLEEFKQNDRKTLFVHVETKDTITTAMIKELRREFEILKDKVKKAGYSTINSYSATPKFYCLFKGYKDLGPIDVEGEEYRVLQWELK